MSVADKVTIKLGNFSVTTSGAQTFTPAADPQGGSRVNTAAQLYSRCDVLLNVITLSGTSPTTQPSFQERFSDVGFVETANWGATITSTGKYYMSNDGQTGQSGTANTKYGYASLGKGLDKQIVFTNGGTIGAISVDCYVIFY